MRPIPEEIVERTSEYIADLQADAIVEIVNTMADSQPIVFAFLMMTADDYLNEEEQELLLFLGISIWKMMLHVSGENLPEVSDVLLQEKEELNNKMLTFLANDTDPDFIDSVHTIFSNYNQPEVLRYVVETLMEEDEEFEEEMSEEGKGHMLICLKTVIDCFDSVETEQPF